MKFNIDIIKNIYMNYSILDSNDKLCNILQNSNINATPSNARNRLYQILKKFYPNEMIVKSEFINKYLYKKYNDITIFELPIGNSRIDLCKVNGKSVAYEIKTEFDTFFRLNKQLDDYSQVFEEVYVLCPVGSCIKLEKYIKKEFGIISYSQNKFGTFIFEEYRACNMELNLNLYSQLNCLRLTELKEYFNLKKSNNYSRKDLISNIVHNFMPNEINSIFKQVIKNRYEKNWQIFLQNKKYISSLDYQWFYKNMVSPNFIYN